MKLRNLFVVGVASAMVLASCGGKKETKTPTVDTTKTETVDTTAKVPEVVNIVETAKKDTSLSTLVELLGTAGLVEKLSDANAKYTVFAPTNDAFRKLDPKKLDALRTDEKKRQELVDILTYHVVSGELMSANLMEMTELDALAEKVVKITAKDGKVMVGKSNVTTADIKASNGVIHVIDVVMMPPAKKGKAKPQPTTTTTTTTTTTQTTSTATTPNGTSTGRGNTQESNTSTGRGNTQESKTSTGRGNNK